LIGDDDTVTFYLTRNQAIFEAGWWQIAIQLLEGNFPDMTMIIPNESATDAVFGAASLASATRTANLFSRDAANIVEYKFTAAGVEISATSQEMGDHSGNIALMDFQGEEITIAFNGKYLAEYLATLAGTSGVLRLNSASQPGLFLCNHLNYHHVIMPMHIKR
jgi:DNA polymerase-3 subunit beta